MVECCLKFVTNVRNWILFKKRKELFVFQEQRLFYLLAVTIMRKKLAVKNLACQDTNVAIL